MAELYTRALGHFTGCPECKYASYYPFPEGYMCVRNKCGHSGNEPVPDIYQPEMHVESPVEQPKMSKNQRRKANQRAKREVARGGLS